MVAKLDKFGWDSDVERVLLSKSRVCKGLVCEKALYLDVHEKQLTSSITPQLQQIFNIGHKVSLYAQKRFPDGLLINISYRNPQKALKETKRAIDGGVLTLFEPAFMFDGVLIRVDILHRETVESPWKLYEIKSTTELKKEHLADVAVQAYVVKGAGLPLEKYYLSHLNKGCVYPDLSNLFFDVDLTNDIRDLENKIPNIISNLKNLLKKSEPPEIDIGPYCTDPYECSFQEHCWLHIPKVSVFNIPRLKSKQKWSYYYQGKVELKNIPQNELKEVQATMVNSTLNSTQFISSEEISVGLNDLKYPLSFLDFETIAPAIPKFEGSRPYAPNIPFQFALYIIDEINSEPRLVEYLHGKDTDPRSNLLEILVKEMPKTGSVVAYNKGFEAGVLKALATYNNSYRSDLENMISRLWDPLSLIRKHVYDPAFEGSFSIKNVAPALLGEKASYKNLDIGEGYEAQRSYFEMVASDTLNDRKENLRKSLLEYCRKDTFLMIELVNWLKNEVSFEK